VAAVAAIGSGHDSGAADAARRTPSGLPVPRYVSLKFGEVNARAGPGDDYKLLWTYRQRGLPLQVVAETSDWRRVCDPEGAIAWVHQRTVDTRRTVMRTQAKPLAMRRRPDAKSGQVALLAGRSLASLEMCKAGWCRVEAGRAKGWVPASELWGVAGEPQCRPPPPPRPHG
jgi:SH3-like domain-containing protein